MEDMSKTKSQLEQIFVYLTLRCNAQCITCYMYKHYSTIREMSFEVAKDVLKKYHSLGAKKLTLLGGEPTLHSHLEELVEFAKNTGYSYVRIQTNGQFDSKILTSPLVQKNVDTFSFSMDGHTEDFNHKIRKGCSLNKTLENLRLAKQLGYDVRVNVTVTSINIVHIFDIIALAENNDVSMIYLNIVFPMGAASSQPYLAVSPEQWIDVFNKIRENSHKFKVRVKVPVGYASYYPVEHHCIAFEIKRLYVMPNGDAYPCILFVDNTKLRLDEEPYYDKLTNRVKVSSEKMNSYCHFLRFQGNKLRPLCIYYRKIFGGGKQ